MRKKTRFILVSQVSNLKKNLKLSEHMEIFNGTFSSRQWMQSNFLFEECMQVLQSIENSFRFV